MASCPAFFAFPRHSQDCLLPAEPFLPPAVGHHWSNRRPCAGRRPPLRRSSPSLDPHSSSHLHRSSICGFDQETGMLCKSLHPISTCLVSQLICLNSCRLSSLDHFLCTRCGFPLYFVPSIPDQMAELCRKGRLPCAPRCAKRMDRRDWLKFAIG